MADSANILVQLQTQFGEAILATQTVADGTPTLWIGRDDARRVLAWLQHDIAQPYAMLLDLFGIDERSRVHRIEQPQADFTVVYTLLSLQRDAELRVKVPLTGEFPSLPTVTDLWPNANWYERELWDMFGVTVIGHPNLRRILCPPWWQGHALRKEHPARATEMEPFALDDASQERHEQALEFWPADWGLSSRDEDGEFMFLNIGPHHPGTHGVLRLMLQLRDEEIVNLVPEIGFHHRAAEKMAERQTWHTFLPYTDRVDYLSGALNELPYVLSVESLAGLDVPPRAAMIRVLLCELYRIASHLVWLGTFALDLGHFSGVFYLFNNRERIMELMQGITGARLHPGYFRVGGVTEDLPDGWREKTREFVSYFPARLAEAETMILHNRVFRARTRGVGAISTSEAVAWGVTGPNLRATGLAYDLRRQRRYSGYGELEFDVPVGGLGDCYDRAAVRVEEMRQSLRIVSQCVERMPGGETKSSHPLATPPRKPRTMRDIETLITHFLGVTYGPVVPPGEAMVCVEGAKGINGYYCISDGLPWSYRTHIRTPSFPHIQMTPRLATGLSIADLIAILGSIDYVMADVDR